VKRTRFDLKKAEERAHILEGLAKALKVIDKVIATIKKSKDRDEAYQNLRKVFKFSEPQANAILEMKLHTLARLEHEKIEAELKEKLAFIQECNLILKSPSRILKIIKNELEEIKEKYGDERRTKVVAAGLTAFNEEDLIVEEQAIITLSSGGYIKRVTPDVFRLQRRGGKGLIGSDVAEEDFLSHFVTASTHAHILFFTDRGRVFQTKVYDIPVGSRVSKGRAIHNFLELSSEEKVSAIVAYKEGKVKDAEGNPKYLVMATKSGLIKRTPLNDFKNIRRTGIIAISLQKNDALRWVRSSRGSDEVIMVTRQGQSIRFKEGQVRSMGRTAAGVRGIRLKSKDEVVGFDIMERVATAKSGGGNFLVVMEHGFAKQTPLSDYRLQNRGGGGVRTAKITPKTGALVSGQIVSEATELLALSKQGQIIRTRLESIRTASRGTQGVRIMNVAENDKIAGMVLI
jgi:DNA gyrase subunit A